jgi:hypothetical protein
MVQFEVTPELVIVSNVFDLISRDVQNFQTLGKEGIIKPLKLVGRDIEKSKLSLSCQDTVQFFQFVIVQSQHPQGWHQIKHSVIQESQLIVSQVERL